ncbi:hypothetical protein BDA99DRAFT_565100 [Phascolomyces articulosus]|uniref:Uncharacterized protein n=1 Tax=Phascolomyces articulosus TaxID=60185 RepID=A0AAD5P8G7_9FUNG|nr:hypothetical protein BDA99DRAFT_565100 [Phascolomyces articulosus]
MDKKQEQEQQPTTPEVTKEEVTRPQAVEKKLNNNNNSDVPFERNNNSNTQSSHTTDHQQRHVGRREDRERLTRTTPSSSTTTQSSNVTLTAAQNQLRNDSSHCHQQITQQKDCFTAMGVSKLWMERVPLFTPKAMETIKLVGTKHALHNTLLHQCLVSQSVKTLVLCRFLHQGHFFQMMDIVQRHNYMNQTELEKKRKEIDRCKVEDHEEFLDRLKPIIQDLEKLTIKEYDGVLSILSICFMCPQLQKIECQFANTVSESSSREPLPEIVLFSTQTEVFSNLTCLTVESKSPSRTSNRSSVNQYQQQHKHHRINCSGQDLVLVINQSPFLTEVTLVNTGDNLDPVVIQAIEKLEFICELGLFYDLEPNHQDGALYSLPESHTIVLSPLCPIRKTNLYMLSLNVVDDKILDIMGRIPLQFVELTDGFNLASFEGLLKFAENTIYYGKILVTMMLYTFDLRSPARHHGPSILNHFARLSYLKIVGFIDCYVERQDYFDFVETAHKLERVALPLYSDRTRELKMLCLILDEHQHVVLLL